MLPIVGKPQLDKRFQKSIPDSLLRPSAETDVDRIPFSIAFVHITPWAANPQNMQHTVQESPVIMKGT